MWGLWRCNLTMWALALNSIQPISYEKKSQSQSHRVKHYCHNERIILSYTGCVLYPRGGFVVTLFVSCRQIWTDLHRKILAAPSPLHPISFLYVAFRNIWQNNQLVSPPPLRLARPPFIHGKSWIRHCNVHTCSQKMNSRTWCCFRSKMIVCFEFITKNR